MYVLCKSDRHFPLLDDDLDSLHATNIRGSFNLFISIYLLLHSLPSSWEM